MDVVFSFRANLQLARPQISLSLSLNVKQNLYYYISFMFVQQIKSQNTCYTKFSLISYFLQRNLAKAINEIDCYVQFCSYLTKKQCTCYIATIANIIMLILQGGQNEKTYNFYRNSYHVSAIGQFSEN